MNTLPALFRRQGTPPEIQASLAQPTQWPLMEKQYREMKTAARGDVKENTDVIEHCRGLATITSIGEFAFGGLRAGEIRAPLTGSTITCLDRPAATNHYAFTFIRRGVVILTRNIIMQRFKTKTVRKATKQVLRMYI